MFNWIEKYKQNKEFRKREAEEKLLLRKGYCEKKVSDKTIEMLSSPCPMNESDSCYQDCAHFKKGYVQKIPLYKGGYGWAWQRPVCRLWK